jgi:hypothetical protein
MSLPASNGTEDADLCIGRNEIIIGLCLSTSYVRRGFCWIQERNRPFKVAESGPF